MSFVDQLAPGLYVLQQAAKPAPPEELQTAQAYFGLLPSDYLTITAYAEWITVQNDAGFVMQVWSPADCVGFVEDHGVQCELAGGFPFASEGGAAFYVERLTGGDPGVYLIPTGAMDWDFAQYVASSIFACLHQGIGLNVR